MKYDNKGRDIWSILWSPNTYLICFFQCLFSNQGHHHDVLHHATKNVKAAGSLKICQKIKNII